MKFLSLLVIVTSLAVTNGLLAQQQKTRTAKLPTVETKWQGVNFDIYDVQRIQDNRLLVFVRVVATSRAPAEGVFLSTPPEIPASATKEDIATGMYNAKPFSLASSVMTDDQTLRRYPVLPPVAPSGKAYFPGELINGLLPGTAYMLSIQFSAPPAPPPVEGREPAKQTVSFLLTGAKGPVAKVPVPPPPSED